ncbi:hypothetical protein D3C84_1046060 [compost metagenome]
MSGEKTCRGKSVPGSFGFRNEGDLLAIEGRLVCITFLVMGGEVLGGNLASRLQCGIQHCQVQLRVPGSFQEALGV